MTAYTFDQLITFTRTSAATYVANTGFVTQTPASRNLLTYTQEFDNAAWTKTNSTVTANTVAAPDGTLTADTLVATAGTGIAPLVTSAGTTVASTIYTGSIFVRPGTHTFVQLYLVNQGADWCNFTLTGGGSVQNNGAAVGAISYDSATGWYRISMVYTAGGTDRRLGLAIVPSGTATRVQTGTYAGTETIFIWGAQLEAASAASTYTRNNGGVYPPRFDYDPVTRAPRGLLIEEQRVNLLLRSEEFDNGIWSKTEVTATANAATSPDGTVDADKLVETTGTNHHSIRQGASAGTYVVTVFAKAAERSVLQISGAISTQDFANFNLANGTLGTNGTGATGMSITAYGNGWYRCSVILSTNVNGPYFSIQQSSSASWLASYTGDGTSGIYLWGAQLEAGAFATSYIPTVASQVTRTADLAAITAPMFAPWYRQSEGTLVVKLTPRGVPSGGANVRVLEINDGGASNRNPLLYASSAGSTYFQYRVGGVDQAGLSSSAGYFAANTTITVASAYAANDFAASFSGSAATTDNSGSVATNATQMTIGYATSAPTEVLCGHIQSIDYYPTRLTNAQIQALTA